MERRRYVFCLTISVLIVTFLSYGNKYTLIEFCGHANHLLALATSSFTPIVHVTILMVQDLKNKPL